VSEAKLLTCAEASALRRSALLTHDQLKEHLKAVAAGALTQAAAAAETRARAASHCGSAGCAVDGPRRKTSATNGGSMWVWLANATTLRPVARSTTALKLAASALCVERELERVEGTEARFIVLDLRELEFIDSSGVKIIVMAHRREAGSLIVVKGPRPIQRVFELCDLVRQLSFVDDLADGGDGEDALKNADGAKGGDEPGEPLDNPAILGVRAGVA
jgi:anti-anti-sigma factor